MTWNYRVIKEDGQDHLYIAPVYYKEVYDPETASYRAHPAGSHSEKTE